jgi:hypothetical protein
MITSTTPHATQQQPEHLIGTLGLSPKYSRLKDRLALLAR